MRRPQVLRSRLKLRCKHFRFLWYCPAGSGHTSRPPWDLQARPEHLRGSQVVVGALSPDMRGLLGLAQLVAPQPRVGQRSPPPLGEGVSSEDLVAWGSEQGLRSFASTSLHFRGEGCSNPSPAASCLSFLICTSSQADWRDPARESD